VVSRDITERKKAEENLKKSLSKLQETIESTVEAVARIVEIRDPYTAGHQRRVADLAFAIAKEMGLPEKQANGIKMAALVHDVGKLYIPAEILVKPTTLTEIEFGMVKTHPRVCYEILKTVKFPWPVADIILQHHERCDGSGYLQGLKKEKILLEARILAVADVVEAMSSHRPYRPARGLDKTLAEITKNKGMLYDPDVVGACLRVFQEKGFAFQQYKT
jgi:putative nucleotidyltransferase with HDIG domain